MQLFECQDPKNARHVVWFLLAPHGAEVPKWMPPLLQRVVAAWSPGGVWTVFFFGGMDRW